MTTHDWLELEPDEEIEWEAHPRLMRAAPAIAVGVLLVAIAIAGGVLVDSPIYALVLAAPAPVVVAYLRVINTRYVATNRALYLKRGLFGVDVRTVELDRVQNTRSTQGVLGTAFGHGTVEIEVAGGRDIQFADIYDPDDVRRLVEDLGGGQERLPGTVEQWKEVRSELRAIRRVLENQPK